MKTKPEQEKSMRTWTDIVFQKEPKKWNEISYIGKTEHVHPA